MNDPKEWYCRTCHCVVPPEYVTNDETHDKSCGGCGARVIFEDVPREITKPINDGGPAFPTPSGYAIVDGYQPGIRKFTSTVEVCKTGMSLRDWFAGQAMYGATSLCHYEDIKPEVMAAKSYTIADAMLAAREVKP